MKKLAGILLLFVLIFLLCVTSCKPRQSFIHKNDKGYVVTFSRKDLKKAKKVRDRVYKQGGNIQVDNILDYRLRFNSIYELHDFFALGDISYQKAEDIYFELASSVDKNNNIQLFDLDEILQLNIELDKLDYVDLYKVWLYSDSYSYEVMGQIIDCDGGYHLIFNQNSLNASPTDWIDQNAEKVYTTQIDGYNATVSETMESDGSISTNVRFDTIVLDDGTIDISRSYSNNTKEDERYSEDIRVYRVINGVKCQASIYVTCYDKACDHEYVCVEWIIENTQLMPYDEAYEQQILDKVK